MALWEGNYGNTTADQSEGRDGEAGGLLGRYGSEPKVTWA